MSQILKVFLLLSLIQSVFATKEHEPGSAEDLTADMKRINTSTPREDNTALKEDEATSLALEEHQNLLKLVKENLLHSFLLSKIVADHQSREKQFSSNLSDMSQDEIAQMLKNSSEYLTLTIQHKDQLIQLPLHSTLLQNRPDLKQQMKNIIQEIAKIQFNLGFIYMTGNEDVKNLNEAVKYFKLSADQGEAQAQFALGTLLYTGEGVPENKNEAVKYLKLSADQGNSEAQFKLGTLLYTGKGVPENKNEAVKYFTLAADQRHARALFILGVHYAVEKITEQKAIQYYTEAARQGYPVMRSLYSMVMHKRNHLYL